jgi:hypothetical protein
MLAKVVFLPVRANFSANRFPNASTSPLDCARGDPELVEGSLVVRMNSRPSKSPASPAWGDDRKHQAVSRLDNACSRSLVSPSSPARARPPPTTERIMPLLRRIRPLLRPIPRQVSGEWQGKTTGGEKGGAPRRHPSPRDATASPGGVEVRGVSRLIFDRVKVQGWRPGGSRLGYVDGESEMSQDPQGEPALQISECRRQCVGSPRVASQALGRPTASTWCLDSIIRAARLIRSAQRGAQRSAMRLRDPSRQLP